MKIRNHSCASRSERGRRLRGMQSWMKIAVPAHKQKEFNSYWKAWCANVLHAHRNMLGCRESRTRTNVPMIRREGCVGGSYTARTRDPPMPSLFIAVSIVSVMSPERIPLMSPPAVEGGENSALFAVHMSGGCELIPIQLTSVPLDVGVKTPTLMQRYLKLLLLFFLPSRSRRTNYPKISWSKRCSRCKTGMFRTTWQTNCYRVEMRDNCIFCYEFCRAGRVEIDWSMSLLRFIHVIFLPLEYSG